jgi:drug/metabolite transporter (DMT)-like permease
MAMRHQQEMSALWTAGLTVTALVAFAANSLLCRLALGAAQVDAASYTSLRLSSGALILWAITAMSGRSRTLGKSGSWLSAAMLFLYAVAFSFAYLSLDAGTGALILFGSVQATMILAGFIQGHRPHLLEWIGMISAFGGLVYLVSPGLSAPAPFGSALMALSGIAWGIYTLRGRGSSDPVASTAGNFARAAPLAIPVSLVLLSDLDISARGAWLAVLSGALTSALGYVIWYAALKGLTTTRAAIVQLSVPVLAAVGGVFFLSETVSHRLLVSGIVILGGIALAIWGRDYVLRVSAETSGG